MEVEIRTEPGRQEPKVIILAGEESEELRRLADRLAALAVYSLICDAAIPPLQEGGDDGGMSISLGGTSLIILVGVALETVRQLESQMMMRHYKGFLD